MSDPQDVDYIVATHWVMYISPIVNDWNYYNDAGEEYELPSDAQTRLPALFGRIIGASVQQIHSRLISATSWASQATPGAFSTRFSQMTRASNPAIKPDSETTGPIGPLLTGPTTFGFDRLWAITGALIEVFGTNDGLLSLGIHTSSGGVGEEEVSRAHFLGQINNLVSRKLIVRMTQEKLEMQVMYKAAISMEQASALSDSIGFKLGPLLYEETH
ncbi:hypothetical protein FRC17_009141 [Serendipita sp. 399]|nr:hypothetical protein FRC17_009141 [Serendipita sp. 399]